ncbi:MAG: hypothetical protein PWP65_641 [Clostridia bacterium]|nr:hypothetical protein [Clostridia bacterium]
MVDKKHENTVFITGYGQIPSNVPSYHLYKVVVVGVEIDLESGLIIDAYCTLATPLARRLICSILRGRKLPEEVPAIIKEIEKRYIAYSQKAVIFAVKELNKRFLSLKEHKEEK